jgi:PAS domain S-box-containing protein
MREVLDGVADWIWETDAETRITYVSERFFERFGFARDNVIGWRVAAFMPPPEAEAQHRWDAQRLMTAIAAMRPFRDLTGAIRSLTGEFATVRVSAVPIVEDGKAIGMRGTATDITELAEAQTNLAQVEKMTALGGLVAGLAHEINTPIGVGLTGATALARRAREVARLMADGKLRRSDFDAFLTDAVAAADIVEINLTRAAELIGSFKKVSLDQTHDQRGIVELAAYVKMVLISLTPETRRNGHVIATEIPDDIAIETVPGALAQILTNLVMNSLIHGFPDGRTGRICLSARRQRNGVELVFRDDGKGADAETVRRLYEPFFTTRRGQGGSGLGMSIVYTLITNRLGGRIVTTSALDHGMEHRIWLPGVIAIEPAAPGLD